MDRKAEGSEGWFARPLCFYKRQVLNCLALRRLQQGFLKFAQSLS